tara:strand:+ start:5643 stop:5885 length:243 start_codon:yes stop_codon:yes gene_type:complete
MEDIERRLCDIEKKIDIILSILEDNVKPNCDKMGSHINFVESVYDNVKNPLGFICSRVNYLRGSETKSYSLENNTTRENT